MNRSFRLFTLIALSLFAVVAQAATAYQHIYITCIDKHGNLIGRDTIKTPAGECFFLKAPSIPYYKCVDHSQTGSNVCIHTDEHLTMKYETTGFSGFTALSNESIDKPAEEMGVVLLTAEEHPRVWCTADSSQVKLLPLTAEGHTPGATWILRSTDEGWTFYNEMGNCYLSDLLADGTARTSDHPLVFDIVKDKQSKVNRFNLRTADGRQFSVRLSRYLPRVYFGLSASFLDEKDSTLAPERFIPIAAGANERFIAPQIKGYRFFNSPDFSIDAPLYLNNFFDAKLIYRPAPLSVHTPSRQLSAQPAKIFDLSGRRLPQREHVKSTSRNRLLIVDGKLQMQP